MGSLTVHDIPLPSEPPSQPPDNIPLPPEPLNEPPDLAEVPLPPEEQPPLPPCLPLTDKQPVRHVISRLICFGCFNYC